MSLFGGVEVTNELESVADMSFPVILNGQFLASSRGTCIQDLHRAILVIIEIVTIGNIVLSV